MLRWEPSVPPYRYAKKGDRAEETRAWECAPTPLAIAWTYVSEPGHAPFIGEAPPYPDPKHLPRKPNRIRFRSKSGDREGAATSRYASLPRARDVQAKQIFPRAWELTFQHFVTAHMLILLALLQSAPLPVSAQAEGAAAIEISGRATVKSLEIKSSGDTRVELRADPGTTDVRTEQSHPSTRRSFRNATFDFRAAAHVTPHAAEGASADRHKPPQIQQGETEDEESP